MIGFIVGVALPIETSNVAECDSDVLGSRVRGVAE
jgi:hypothetical protein